MIILNKLQQYLRNRRTRTNIRVMIEISRDYKTFIKVTQLQLTRSQFYNMTEQQRFNLLHDAIGGVEWGSIYDELGLALLFISLILILVFGVVII
ncbi:hypothetical protein [Aeromonas phage 4L372D]|uniref:Uncharacterized protein n=2 Tax=Plateaulakevirus TaxID=2843436 RepID=A0A5B9N9K3_9CAUD|nr:hypothetical protein HWC25_gp002 [Aeromonas phage 2L372D]YP_009846784.1 hypothetical protein HWC27_gp155 [Aeromonas phage 4L372D]QDB73916.1 hypothetical protein 2L372D_002 [Aeromonas phage 2L372D]QEG08700.1 hypothetical protein [Aeromonas phage 4L372D]